MLGKNEDIDNWLSVSWKMKKVSKDGERYTWTVLEGQRGSHFGSFWNLRQLLGGEEKQAQSSCSVSSTEWKGFGGSSVVCGWYGKTSGGEQTKEVAC